jgi:hypothetical protein
MAIVNHPARAEAGIAAALDDQAKQPECNTADHDSHRDLGHRHLDGILTPELRGPGRDKVQAWI